MKTLTDYLAESETWMQTPAEGDSFAIELADGTLIESYIFETADDSILLDATPEIVAVLESWNLLSDQESNDAVILETAGHSALGGASNGPEAFAKMLANKMVQSYPNGFTLDFSNPWNLHELLSTWPEKKWVKEFERLWNRDLDEIVDADLWNNLRELGFEPDESEQKWTPTQSNKQGVAKGSLNELAPMGYNTMVGEEDLDMDEAKYQGREVPLNKKMAGDRAKFKVYVKDPATGNVKKVNFGDKNMRIKKSNPARRKSFRARHNCENPGPRTKARYWSCRAW